MNSRSSHTISVQKSLYLICLLQVFSTISFAVMYSTLTLYMKQQLGFSSHQANLIAGVFFACNFALHVLSGAIGGNLLSFRLALFCSIIFQSIGGLLLAHGGLGYFYLGLSTMLLGSGTMITSINMIVGQHYEASDKRREKAFFLSYSAMNIGFLVGFLIAGWFQMHQAFQALFLSAAAINACCIVLIIIAGASFADLHSKLSLASKAEQGIRLVLGLAILCAMIPVVYLLLKHALVGSSLVLVLGVMMLIGMLVYTLSLPRALRSKMIRFVALILAAQAFWIIYQIAPMGLMLFAKREVDLHFLGISIAPAWISTINAATIIIGGPLLGLFFQQLRKKFPGAINESLQFVGGLFCCALALFLLKLGIVETQQGALIPFAWLLVYAILQGIAELLISPVSLSMVGSLVPQKAQSMMMGIALLNVGVAAILASYLSNFALGNQAHLSHVALRHQFGTTLLDLGVMVAMIAVLLALFYPWFHKHLKPVVSPS